MKRKSAAIITAASVLISTMTVLSSCGTVPAESDGTRSVSESEIELSEDAQGNKEPEILHFVDVFGQEYSTEIREDVEKHDYDWKNLTREGERLSYEDEEYTSRFGIDVSHHQGDIDWEKVRAEGVTFAFIRIGYRGYGEEGKICPDTRALENIREAQAQGIDVGVYFFSQAVSETEALEEADFVLSSLGNIDLQLPVVYDPESILDDEARTDDITGEQFTKNTRVFCDAIREAGYESAIYSNMLWEAYEFDLAQLSDLDIWYADYEEEPQTPYYFTFWQYSNEGTINGIEGDVDLNLQIYEKTS